MRLLAVLRTEAVAPGRGDAPARDFSAAPARRRGSVPVRLCDPLYEELPDADAGAALDRMPVLLVARSSVDAEGGEPEVRDAFRTGRGDVLIR